MRLIMVDSNGDTIELDPAAVGTATTARMLRIFERCITLQRRKAQAYGDAYRSQGYMGNLGRVLGKASRLRNMLWGDWNEQFEDAEETTYDTIYDLINLCTFFIINREDSNKWGQDA